MYDFVILVHTEFLWDVSKHFCLILVEMLWADVVLGKFVYEIHIDFNLNQTPAKHERVLFSFEAIIGGFENLVFLIAWLNVWLDKLHILESKQRFKDSSQLFFVDELIILFLVFDQANLLVGILVQKLMRIFIKLRVVMKDEILRVFFIYRIPMLKTGNDRIEEFDMGVFLSISRFHKERARALLFFQWGGWFLAF